MQNSALYAGNVFHMRLRPRRHKLRYRVFSLLLDLDELDELDRTLRLFGHNRFALFSFHDSDHGDGTKSGLRDWALGLMKSAGEDIDGVRIRVLCYPRILGYVFNPLTVFFCYGPDGALRTILYEVCNTFHERHTYIIAATANDGSITQSCRKELYVSPFIPMDCTYNFNISPPGETVRVAIDETDKDGKLLVAIFAASRKPLADRTLFAAFFTYPLMTAKILAAIHWEAVILWIKGIKVISHLPARTKVASTVVSRPPRQEASS
jgi:hypothetical protein